MERDDSVYLRHILDAISRIEEYLMASMKRCSTNTIWFRMVSFGNLRSSVKPVSDYHVKYEPVARTYHGRT